ncbi:HD-GYP domain-containing protein [Thermodesulfobacteriota bacterium]
MTENNPPDCDMYMAQLAEYAKDLREIYKSERAKSEELQVAHQQLINYAESLNDTLAQLKGAYADLNEAYLDTIHRLALAAEYKDQETGDHLIRMSRYCKLVAEKMGLPEKQVQNIFYAAPMHDVGKIGIPENILMKPGKLTDEEFEIIKKHPKMGADILANSKSEILQLAEKIAICHHERWDGKGYPCGIVGEDIPITCRIVALADTFDALTSRRPYKDPYPVEVALEIVKRGRGSNFDPAVVDVFLGNFSEVLRIKEEVGSIENLSLADFAWSERDLEAGNVLQLAKKAAQSGN